MSRKFYGVIAISMILGLVRWLQCGEDAVLFSGAERNTGTALNCSSRSVDEQPTVMGARVSSRPLRYLGWAAAVIMTLATVGMFVTIFGDSWCSNCDWLPTTVR
jgi:hypothetical protein